MGIPSGRGLGPRAPRWAALALTALVGCAPEPEAVEAPAAAPESLRFDARTELATTGKPEGVLAHDFDGDGRAELLAATRSPGSLHLWSAPGAEPRRIALPDYLLGPRLVDGPGGTKVVLASRETRELLFLDPTDPGPEAGLERRALPGTPRALGVGPLDRDTAPTIAVATREGELVVLRGERMLRTALVDDLATFVTPIRGWVLVGSQAETCVRAYRADGPDAWTVGPACELGGIPRACVEREDALWIAGGDGALWILDRPAADGSLELREERRLDAIPIDLELAGDGRDLVVLSFYELRYAVESGGTWRARGYAGQDPWDASCGDLDGDGLWDLAIANRGARRVSVLLGAPDGGFHEGLRLPTGRGPHALAVGDVDGDGTQEILVMNALAGDLALLRRRGATWEVVERHDARPAGDVVAVGDLDGDGYLDAAFAVRSAHGSRLRVLFGTGSGGFAARAQVDDLALGTGAGDLVLVDLDGDGRAEAVIADPEGGAVHVAGSTADGGLALRQSLAVPSAPRALALLDGGRTLAVAVGEPGPRFGVALLAREGERLFERGFVATEDLPIDLAAGDIDGDGREELVLLAKASRGDGPGLVRVLREDPDGTWSAVVEAPTGLRPYAVAVGRIDGDSFADVVVGAQNSHHVNVWRGLPGARLQRLADLGCGRGPLDVRIADLDGDGLGEVLVANDFSNDVSVLALRAGADAER